MTKKVKTTGEIKQLETGSHKDIAKGRGRYDLLPLATLGKAITALSQKVEPVGIFLRTIDRGMRATDIERKKAFLYEALALLTSSGINNKEHLIKVVPDLAKLYEAGASKYEARDWEKGRPMEIFIDSTVRHFFQYLNGETDEDHYTAAVWNLLSCIDTLERIPEMAYTIK